MNIFNWFTSLFTSRGKALSLYRQGMAKAKKRDHDGAIVDYTASINVSNAPLDVKAMALYNRALVHAAIGEDDCGADDLEAVLAMDEAQSHIKTMAKQKLGRMESRSVKAKLAKEKSHG